MFPGAENAGTAIREPYFHGPFQNENPLWIGGAVLAACESYWAFAKLVAAGALQF